MILESIEVLHSLGSRVDAGEFAKIGAAETPAFDEFVECIEQASQLLGQEFNR